MYVAVSLMDHCTMPVYRDLFLKPLIWIANSGHTLEYRRYLEEAFTLGISQAATEICFGVNDQVLDALMNSDDFPFEIDDFEIQIDGETHSYNNMIRKNISEGIRHYHKALLTLGLASKIDDKLISGYAVHKIKLREGIFILSYLDEAIPTSELDT